MIITPVLEVAISLALLYLFFSQVVSSAFEFLASIRNSRGRYLREWLNKALNSGQDKNWAELFYRHPSVDMLAKSATKPPSYVPSSVFAKVLADLVIDEARTHEFVPVKDAQGQPTGDMVYQMTPPVGPGDTPLTPLKQLMAGMERILEGDFKALLRTTLLNAEGCSRVGTASADDAAVFDQFIHGLAVWYDNYMDRVSGWYKRHVKGYLFWLSLLIAALCNLDSLRVASYLWHHGDERRQIVAVASQYVRDHPNGPATTRPLHPHLAKATTAADTARAYWQAYRSQLDSLTAALQGTGFPIGWQLSGVPSALDSTTLDSVFLVAIPARQVLLDISKDMLKVSRAKKKPDSTATRKTDAAAAHLPKSPSSGVSSTTQASQDSSTSLAISADNAAAASAPAQSKASPGSPPPGKRQVISHWSQDGIYVDTLRLWNQPAHYIRYERQQKHYSFNGLRLSRLTWKKTILPADTVLHSAQLSSLVRPSYSVWRALRQQFSPWALLGWLLTAAALTLGAPFWFELLNRFVNMRNIGLKPPTAQSTGTPATEPN